MKIKRKKKSLKPTKNTNNKQRTHKINQRYISKDKERDIVWMIHLN